MILVLLVACTFEVPGSAGDDTGAPAPWDDPDRDGYVAGDDCDTDDPSVNPAAPELCGDAIDNDCDGEADEAAAEDALLWYADADGDGHGDPRAPLGPSCEGPAGAVTSDGDCDDARDDVHPDAPELCDLVDNDCDGSADEDAIDAQNYYYDGDEDGYGDASYPRWECAMPSGYADDASDCDDDNNRVNPGVEEVCGDGVDQDCDGLGCNFSDTTSVSDAEDALQIKGASYGDYAGKSVCLPGDLNGDTFPDLLVTAYLDDDSQTDMGAAHIFFGPLDGSEDDTEDSDLALWGTDHDDYLGYLSAGLSDADGDGYDDLAVSSKTTEVYVAYGPLDSSTSGWDENINRTTPGDASFGRALASGADGSGDGHPEMSVGQPGYDTERGLAMLFDGDTLGDGIEGALAYVTTSVESSMVGTTVAIIDDLDGTGLSSWAVGAPNVDDRVTDGGLVAFFQDSPSGGFDLSDGALFWGDVTSSYAGMSLTAAGDVDGDGYDDVLIGAPLESTSDGGTGVAHLVPGAAAFGDAGTVSATTRIESTVTADELSLGMAALGDMDQDGHDDVIIGAPYSDGVWAAGSAGLFYGPISGTLTLDDADASFLGSSGNHVGSHMAGGRDLNDDGAPDLVFGQPTALSSYGLASVLLGDGV